jgi:peptide/nickel transport system substrate-binding protein
MKKFIAMVLAALMFVSMVACTAKTEGTTASTGSVAAASANTSAASSSAASSSAGEAANAAQAVAESGKTADTGWKNVVYASAKGGNINAVDYDTKATSTKDTLVVQIPTDPGTFDLTYQQTAQYTLTWVYNKLLTYRYDETGAVGAFVTPESLATDYKVDDDGLGITFTLRQGVKFSNGYDFKAEDAKFSLQHASSLGDLAVMDADNITVVDDYTIHVPLKHKDANAVYDVGGIAQMHSYKYWQECGGKAGDAEFCSTKAIGTGPYMLKKWTSGDSIELVANPYYFNDEPIIKNVILRVISDPSVAFMALQNGEIDWMTDTSCNWTDVSTVVNGSVEGITDYVEYSTTCHTLIEDCSEGSPLADLNVRKAIAYAINRKDIATYVYEGAGYCTDSIVSMSSPGTVEYNPWPYEYSPEKAKACLKEAGYEPNELSLNIVIGAGDTLRGSAAELMISTFAECGMKLEIKYVDIAAVADTLINQPQEWDLALKGTSNGNYTEPYAATFFSDTGVLSVQCHPQKDPAYAKMVELAKQMNEAASDEERNKVWKELQDYYLSDCMYSYKIVSVVGHNLISSHLKNYSKTYYYNYDVAHAYFE